MLANKCNGNMQTLWKLNTNTNLTKQLHVKVHLVAVLGLSIESHDPHLQMEFAHLSWKCRFSNFLFPEQFKDLEGNVEFQGFNC